MTMRQSFNLLLALLISFSSFGQITGIFKTVSTSGTNTYTAPAPSDMSASYSAYVNWHRFDVIFTNANTSTTVTLNINSLGAKNVYNSAGQALTVGEIKAGDQKWLSYSTALNGFRIIGGGSGGGNTITASNGLTKTGDDIAIGGEIDDNTELEINTPSPRELTLTSRISPTVFSRFRIGVEDDGEEVAPFTRISYDNEDATHSYLSNWTKDGILHRFSIPGATSEIQLNSTGVVVAGLLRANDGINVPDATFSILDDVTPTKIAKFQASGITSGQTRTFTFPDVNGTLALIAQTITDGVTTSSPSQDAVRDALALKADASGVWSTTGTTTVTTPTISGSVTFSGGKVVFTPSATTTGFNWGSFAGVPSTTVNGDGWYNSTAGFFQGKANNNNQTFVQVNSGGSLASNRVVLASNAGTVSSSGNLTFDGIALALSGYQTFTGITTPSQITSNQNDYNPTGWSTSNTLRLTTDANRSITSLAGGVSGRKGTICNCNAAGGSTITLTQDDGSTGTAANRFVTAITIDGGKCKTILYDATSSRWREN